MTDNHEKELALAHLSRKTFEGLEEAFGRVEKPDLPYDQDEIEGAIACGIFIYGMTRLYKLFETKGSFKSYMEELVDLYIEKFAHIIEDK